MLFIRSLTAIPATSTIMVSIFFVSLLALANRKLYLRLILHPAGICRKREYYRLFTSDLVHNDLMHLLLNEVMAYYVCGNLERSLKVRSPMGSLYFLLIYLISYFAGVLYVTFRHRNDFEYSSAGASGSILGCMMGFMFWAPNYVALYLPVFGRVNNIYAGLIVIAGLIVYRYRSGNEMMDHERHFFSAVGGLVATCILLQIIL